MKRHGNWTFRGSTANQGSLIGVHGRISHDVQSYADRETCRNPIDCYIDYSIVQRFAAR